MPMSRFGVEGIQVKVKDEARNKSRDGGLGRGRRYGLHEDGTGNGLAYCARTKGE